MSASFCPGNILGDVFQWGRELEGRKTFEVDLTCGKIIEIEGSVEETIRPYYEHIGQDTPGSTYSLSGLGLDGKKVVFGFMFEKQWKYITFDFSGFYYNPTADTTAPADFYIGLANPIEYQGKKYDNMMIPEGRAFTADMKTMFFEINMLVTPTTITPVKNVEFIPSIYLGLVGLFGTYNLDAGDPTGTVVYEYPPEEFVVGGRTDGWAGAGVPAIGLEGELRIGPPDGLRFVLRGGYSFLRYRGSTEYIPINIRREKDLSLNYDNYGCRAQLEFPVSPTLDLVAGINYQHINLSADATAEDQPPEVIEELREKYDKKILFELHELQGIVGVRF